MINKKDEKLCSHKYVVQNWRRMPIATFEIHLYTSSIQIQNSSSSVLIVKE